MALSIPTQIEQDFQSGKASYRTFQTGFGAQSVLPVIGNSYIIIFGYVFNPAGGGWTKFDAVGAANQPMPFDIRQFGTQQILIFTGDDFFPFMHHVDIKSSAVVGDFDPATGFTSVTNLAYEVDNSPQEYTTYIRANKDVSIAHGLVDRAVQIVGAAIPTTPETPQFLSYGGSGLITGVQNDFNQPTFTPNQFLQPYFQQWASAPYSYGLIPAQATAQAWARPDFIGTDGMLPADTRLNALGLRDQVSSNYILTLHYALYQQTNNY